MRSLAVNKRRASTSNDSSTKQAAQRVRMTRARSGLTSSTFVVRWFVGRRCRFGEDVVARETLDRIATRQEPRFEVGLEDVRLVFT